MKQRRKSVSGYLWRAADKFGLARKTKEIFIQACIRIFEDSIRELEKTKKVKRKQKQILKILRKIDQLEKLKSTTPELSLSREDLIRILEPFEEEINEHISNQNIKAIAATPALAAVIVWALFQRIQKIEGTLTCIALVVILELLLLLMMFNEFPGYFLKVLPRRLYIEKTDQRLDIKKQVVTKLLDGGSDKYEVEGVLIGKKIKGGYLLEDIKIKTLYETEDDLLSKLGGWGSWWNYLLDIHKIVSNLKKQGIKALLETSDIDAETIKNMFMEHFKIDENTLKNVIGTFHTHPSRSTRRLHYGDYAAHLAESILLKELSSSPITVIFSVKKIENSGAWVLLDNYKFGRLKIEFVD